MYAQIVIAHSSYMLMLHRFNIYVCVREIERLRERERECQRVRVQLCRIFGSYTHLTKNKIDLLLFMRANRTQILSNIHLK